MHVNRDPIASKLINILSNKKIFNMKYKFFKPIQKKIYYLIKSTIFFNYLKKDFSLLNSEIEINVFVLPKLLFKFKPVN